ncbi:MAG: 50S ribosomal protein L6 [Helicobacter sp.]|nr:50S ribosomal protein L6 [Helicobacter sp.]
MSRIGKQPISIPNAIKVSIDGGKIIFQSSNATKELDTQNRVKVAFENGQLSFQAIDSAAFWGTYRALAQNIVTGLSEGFKKTLEINGVGYKASVSGKVLDLALGFSHPVKYNIPADIDIAVDKNQIVIKGNDKQRVGQIAAEIRSFRPPEPYKGKGVKYSDEIIIRKAGKTAKKK